MFLNFLFIAACEGGTFGVNCEQTCHCAEGGVCDNRMGVCTPAGCQEGWTGHNCNGKQKQMKCNFCFVGFIVGLEGSYKPWAVKIMLLFFKHP